MAKADLQFVLSLSVSKFDAAIKQSIRSVKGMGRKIDGAMGKVEKDFATVNKSALVFKKTLAGVDKKAHSMRSSIVRLGAAIGGGMLFGAAAKSAFSFNQTIEQSRIGIAALVRTFKGVDMESSFKTAADIQKRLQIEGLKTTATYEQLLTALQEGIGPALRENFNPEQIVKFTSGMTQAAAAISLPMDQLGQELRAILDGTIDRNARIAKALQITNADVKGWKDAGTLFEHLQDKLKAFAAAGDQSAHTFKGALSNMQDAIQMALGKGSEKTFSATTAAILKFTKSIVTIDEKAGTFTFNKKIIAAMDGIDKKISDFLNSITADDIAGAIESIVKVAGAVVDVFAHFAGALVTVTNVLGPFAPILVTAAGDMMLFSAALKAVEFAVLGPFRAIKGLAAAFKTLRTLELLSWFGGIKTGLSGLRAAFASAAGGVGILGTALTGMIGAWAAWEAGWQIGTMLNKFDVVKKAGIAMAGGLTNVWLRAKKAWLTLTGGDTSAVQQEIENADRIYSEMFANVGRKAKAAVQPAKELTSTVVNGAHEMASATAAQVETSKIITGQALEQMRAKYQQYADDVARIQEQIVSRERSLSEQLRAMGRSGMSDLQAWRDRKKEAQEYERAAKKAAAAGNFKEAVKLADQAKSAYADLNKEVKEGDQVLVSQGDALQAAMDGVKSAGLLAIDILKQQKQAAQDAANALDQQSGGQLSGKIQKDLNETQKALKTFSGDWGKVWQGMNKDAVKQTETGMHKVEQAIKKIVDKKTGRTIYINVVERIKKAAGGIVRAATGGKLAGYGGGDRIPALLEAGEFIIRKEAVARFGAGIFHALNNFQIPEIPKFATGGPVGAMASGSTVNINLTMPTGNTYQMQSDTMTADKMLRDLARMRRLRSGA